MANDFDWDAYEAKDKSPSFDWDKYEAPITTAKPELGALETFYRDTGIHGYNKSFANVFGFGKHVDNANEAAKLSATTHPNATKAGEVFGDLLASVPFYMAGGQAAKAIPKLGKAGQLVAAAGLGGGGFGFTKNPKEDESRLGNATEDALWSMLVPGANVGAKQLAPKAGKLLAKAVGYKPAKEIADKIAKSDLAKMLTESKAGYKSLFKETAEKGITKTELPKINMKNYFKTNTEAATAYVRSALKSGKIADAHKAYKSLGKFIAKQKRIAKVNELSKPKQLALEEAEKLRDGIKDSLVKTFDKAGGENLSNRFLQLNKNWEEKVLPNLRNKNLNKYRARVPEITADDLMKNLNKSQLFNAQLAPDYREVARHEFIKSLKPGPKAITTGILGALYTGFKS